MTTLVLRGGRVIDPASRRDEAADLWIVDGTIASASDRPRTADETIDVSGFIVSPGLIDCRVVFGEPGYEERVVSAGEVMYIPSNVPHRAEALEDTFDVDVFSPPRQDWLDGTDSYFHDR